MNTTKSFYISKQLVLDAHKKVKENKGGAGIDNVSLSEFERNLKDNLYKIWNRMSSGSYFPPPVKAVEISKTGGGKRTLGIPTVSDRIAQMVVKMMIESKIDPHFHKDSYGYRYGKSALDAVCTTRQRCWKYDWVVDLDIKGFFDNLDHNLVMKAAKKHTKLKWVILYIKRWLKAPILHPVGEVVKRNKGTPQGGVISPLLANLFLHYAFDKWMERNYPNNPFERYADDIIVHCKTGLEAKNMLISIKERLKECNLEVHSTKTKITYCKDSRRIEKFENISFDFLGYTFRPRKVVCKGKTFTGFNPGISNKAKKKIGKAIRKWRLHLCVNKTIDELVQKINPEINGWINYFGKFYISALNPIFGHIHDQIIRWVKRKYKSKRGKHRRSSWWLGEIAKNHPQLLAHWKMCKPRTER